MKRAIEVIDKLIKEKQVIHASTQTTRPKPDWHEYIKSREDFDKWLSSGMFYVYWPDLTWIEVHNYLKEEE